MEFADVVADDRRLPRHGRSYRHTFQRTDRQRKRHRLQRAGRKKHILYKAKSSNQAGELDFTYYNAVYTVENALAKVKDEQGMKRVEKFLKQEICPDCLGSRLSQAARAPKLRGISLDEACQMPLAELVSWVRGISETLPQEMRPMAESICESFQSTAQRLLDLGLGYLSLDRAAATLSTGERQRMQLARASATAQPASFMFWTNRLSVCTPPTLSA